MDHAIRLHDIGDRNLTLVAMTIDNPPVARTGFHVRQVFTFHSLEYGFAAIGFSDAISLTK